MYCRKCGTQNGDNAYRCTQCGEILQQAGAAAPAIQNVPNFLVQSILVTVFCCLPLGIPAIVFSAQVNEKVRAGDIQGAITASKKAKSLGWWSFGVGLGGWIVYVLIMGLAAVAGG